MPELLYGCADRLDRHSLALADATTLIYARIALKDRITTIMMRIMT